MTVPLKTYFSLHGIRYTKKKKILRTKIRCYETKILRKIREVLEIMKVKCSEKKVLNLDEGTSVKRNTTFFRIVKNETNANFK